MERMLGCVCALVSVGVCVFVILLTVSSSLFYSSSLCVSGEDDMGCLGGVKTSFSDPDGNLAHLKTMDGLWVFQKNGWVAAVASTKTMAAAVNSTNGHNSMTNPTVHVPSWPIIVDPMQEVYPPCYMAAMSANFDGNAGADAGDYSLYFLQKALTAPGCYFPSNDAGDSDTHRPPPNSDQQDLRRPQDSSNFGNSKSIKAARSGDVIVGMNPSIISATEPARNQYGGSRFQPRHNLIISLDLGSPKIGPTTVSSRIVDLSDRGQELALSVEMIKVIFNGLLLIRNFLISMHHTLGFSYILLLKKGM